MILQLGHLLEIICHLQSAASGSPHTVQACVRVNLSQDQLPVLELEDPQLCDDHVHTFLACEGQTAVLQYLVLASFSSVLHGDHHFSVCHCHQVHGTSHPFDHLARYHPVGQVS